MSVDDGHWAFADEDIPSENPLKDLVFYEDEPEKERISAAEIADFPETVAFYDQDDDAFYEGLPERNAAPKLISPKSLCEPELIGEQPQTETNRVPWQEEWERSKNRKQPFSGEDASLMEQSPQRNEVAAVPSSSESEPIAPAESEPVAWYTVSEPEEPNKETLILQTTLNAPQPTSVTEKAYIWRETLPESMSTTESMRYDTVEDTASRPEETTWYTAQEATKQQGGALDSEGGGHTVLETKKAENENCISGPEPDSTWMEGTIEPSSDVHRALVEEMEAITVDDSADDCPQWQEDVEDLPAAKEDAGVEDHPQDTPHAQSPTDSHATYYQPPPAPIKRKLKDILRSLPGFSDL